MYVYHTVVAPSANLNCQHRNLEITEHLGEYAYSDGAVEIPIGATVARRSKPRRI